MTHNFGPFETWRNYESIGDAERVKANFGGSKSLSRSVYADNLDDALRECLWQTMREQAGFEAVEMKGKGDRVGM